MESFGKKITFQKKVSLSIQFNVTLTFYEATSQDAMNFVFLKLFPYKENSTITNIIVYVIT